MLSILVSQKRSRGPGSTSSATASKSATYEVFASIRQYALLCSTARRSGIELSSIPSELYIRFPIAELKGVCFQLKFSPDDESATSYAPSKHRQGEETALPVLDLSDQLFAHFNARTSITSSRISFQSIPAECEIVSGVKTWNSVTVELDSSKFETLESYPSLTFLRQQLTGMAFESGSTLGLRYGTGDLAKIVLYCEGEEGQQIGKISTSTNLIIKASNTNQNTATESKEGHRAFMVNKTMDVEYLLMQARNKKNFPVSAILVHGPAGTGKSHLVGQATGHVGYKMVQVTAGDILDVRVASPFDWILKKHLQLPTDDEFAEHPTEEIIDVVLFFDDIDVLLASDEVADLESQRKVLILFEQMIDTLKTLSQKSLNTVVVIGVSNSPGSIGPSTRKLFEREISIDFPDSNARFCFLRQQVGLILGDQLSSIGDEALREVSDSCHGFSLSDIENLVRVASTSATMRKLNIGGKQGSGDTLTSEANPSSTVTTSTNSNPIESSESSVTQNSSLTVEDLKAAKRETTAENLKSDLHLVPTASAKIDRSVLGGLENAFQSLMQSTVWMVKYASQLSRLGVSSPRGVLLFGPPGTGKTLLAKCVASEWNANFLSVSISDLVRGEVGATERQIAALFRTAKAIAPTIVFIDEIQALFSSRDSGSVGAHDKNMISQLTLELDGLTQDSMVAVIGATNRPDWIDPALLRPGRFERCLYIAPPPEPARLHILHNMLSKYNLDRDSVNDAAIESLAKRTVNFSGADIANLCLKAAWNVIKESFGIGNTATPGRVRSGRSTPLKFNFGASPSTSPHPSPGFGGFKSFSGQSSFGAANSPSKSTLGPSTTTSSNIAESSTYSTALSSVGPSEEKIRREHLEEALAEVSPSMTREMLTIYERFQSQYGRADLQAAASQQSTLHTSVANKHVAPRPAYYGGKTIDRDVLMAMRRMEKKEKGE